MRFLILATALASSSFATAQGLPQSTLASLPQSTLNESCPCLSCVCGDKCRCTGGLCLCEGCTATVQIVSVGMNAPGCERHDYLAAKGYAVGVHKFIPSATKGYHDYAGQVQRVMTCNGSTCSLQWVPVASVGVSACSSGNCGTPAARYGVRTVQGGSCASCGR